MRTLPFLVLLVACGSSKLVIDGDSGAGASDDTASTDTGASSPGDSGSNDSGANDSGTTDSGTPPDTGVTDTETTVTYVGTLEGELRWEDRGGRQSADCRGEVRVVRSPDGTLWGQASCGTREWSLDGGLDASWSRDAWGGIWEVEVYRYPVEVSVDGTIDDRTLRGTASYDADWVAFEGTIEAAAQ